MILEKYKYLCENCKHEFPANHVAGGDFTYGQFIVRSEKRGNEAYLDAIDDPVFNELASIVKRNILLRNKSNLEKGSIVQDVFGIACDYAKDGSKFQMNLRPKCPNCNMCNVSLLGPYDPPILVDEDIAFINHHRWNALSKLQREELVDHTLKKMIKDRWF